MSLIKKSFIQLRDAQILLPQLRQTYRNMQGVIGQQLLPLAPKRVEAIQNENFSFTMGHKRSKIDTLLRAGLIRKANEGGGSVVLEQYHHNFWQSDRGYEYHESQQKLFHDIFMVHHAYIVDEIAKRISLVQKPVTLCEIGSGSGMLLDHLASSIPEIQRFVGIDLNQATTERNSRKFSNSKLEFVTADGLEWVKDHGRPNWVFLTNYGVLEYFSQRKLESLLTHIHDHCSPAIFVAIESVSVDHDLESELDSKLFGNEYAFSHNYPYLFQKNGFKTQHIEYSHEHPEFYLYNFIAVTNSDESVTQGASSQHEGSDGQNYPIS